MSNPPYKWLPNFIHILFFLFSPYDWAYMMKICTNWIHMPEKWSEFFDFVSLFFPKFVDIKVGTRYCTQLKGGLQELADQLSARRIGMQHQAGSDAHLTGESFFKLRSVSCVVGLMMFCFLRSNFNEYLNLCKKLRTS